MKKMKIFEPTFQNVTPPTGIMLHEIYLLI